ncbi:MAG: metal-dependent hydrolase [Polyangiales bacterium]
METAAKGMEPERVSLRARNVHFDLRDLPLHYVQGDPFSTHWVNVLHMILPAGERWFAAVFSQALPLVRDAKLREDVVGFIGQEAMHARAHQSAQDHLRTQGIDSQGYVDELEWFFEDRLGPRELAGAEAHSWLVERLSLVASIEHVTAVLGHWILNARALDNAGVHPGMLDLLRWHGAEEVEHRSVAFDLYQHIDGSYRRRLRSHLVVLPILIWLWARGVSYLMTRDPVLAAQPRPLKPRWIDWVRASRKGLLPGPIAFLRAYWSFFRRDFHPAKECSTSQAVAYLASSPAALASAS